MKFISSRRDWWIEDMGTLAIAPWKDEDLEPVMDLWQRVFADRKYDFRMDEAGFRQRVLAHADFDPGGALIARVEGRIVGFVLGVAPRPGETGYLSVLMVDSDFRQKGVGGMLLDAAEGFLSGCGKTEMRIGYKGNPIPFATGVDVKTPAYTFFLNRGFRNSGSVSLFMETTFAEFELREEIEGFIEKNRSRGILFGMCEAGHRDALCGFMEALFPGGWEASVKGCMDGDPPYPVLIATDGPAVVGFAGPIRVGKDGSGGFTGIGTHPDYRRGKIGTVLFNLMCAEFKKRGMVRNTLHTGLNNPAQEIYFGAGYRVRHLVDYGLVKRLG